MKRNIFIIFPWIVVVFVGLRLLQRHIFYRLPFGIGFSSNFMLFFVSAILVLGAFAFYKNKK